MTGPPPVFTANAARPMRNRGTANGPATDETMTTASPSRQQGQQGDMPSRHTVVTPTRATPQPNSDHARQNGT